MPCFERDWTAEQVCRAIRALPIEKARLMEVCGTHTVAIARSGLRRMLPPYVHRRVSCNDEGLSLGQLVIAKKGGGVRVLGSTAEDRGIERP